MNKSLPFLPGYTFRDVTKDRFVFPQTLVHSKGVQISKPFTTGTAKEAIELLSAQNKELDRDKLIELTYGPKREPKPEVFLPRFIAMDKKVLRFQGYFREETEDWAGESYRIRPVKVLYYLENDTMEVIEPKIENSGLIQEYLINAGIELNDSEEIPPDPHAEQRRTMEPRKETIPQSSEDKKLYKFMKYDKKVLRFYGTWQDVLSDPPEMRRVILQYYLADDTLEVLEDHPPNSGRDPYKVLIKRQKVPVDRNELPGNFPLSYMEIKDEDLKWFQPTDFKTGKDILIFGKKIFLYDCDNFTRHYYKTHLGIEEMESIAVAEKPKLLPPKVIPPHTGIGAWDDTLQNCLSLIPKPAKKDFMKELHFDQVVLRFKAKLISPMADDQLRRFVVSFYPSDDSVAINEESIPNSGFPGGIFYKRDKILKKQVDPSVRPVYYQTDDFYVGANIRASGKVFELIDADPYVLTFMNDHPELYSEEHIQTHKDGMSALHIKKEYTKS